MIKICESSDVKSIFDNIVNSGSKNRFSNVDWYIDYLEKDGTYLSNRDMQALDFYFRDDVVSVSKDSSGVSSVWDDIRTIVFGYIGSKMYDFESINGSVYVSKYGYVAMLEDNSILSSSVVFNKIIGDMSDTYDSSKSSRSNMSNIDKFSDILGDIYEVVDGCASGSISVGDIFSNCDERELKILKYAFKTDKILNLKKSSKYSDYVDSMRKFFSTESGVFGDIRNHDKIKGMYLVYSEIGSLLIGDDNSVIMEVRTLHRLDTYLMDKLAD